MQKHHSFLGISTGSRRMGTKSCKLYLYQANEAIDAQAFTDERADNARHKLRRCTWHRRCQNGLQRIRQLAAPKQFLSPNLSIRGMLYGSLSNLSSLPFLVLSLEHHGQFLQVPFL